MANAVARFFSDRRRLSRFWRPVRGWSAKEIAGLFVSLQQGFHSETELSVSFASLAQITIALLTWKAQSFREDGNIRVRSTVHFINRVFCHLRAEFNLRSGDVGATLRPVSYDLQHWVMVTHRPGSGSWMLDLRILLRRVLCFFRGNFLPGGRHPNVGEAGIIDGQQVTAIG